MWVISKEQFDKIEGSILQQREHRAFRILRKEEEFAKIEEEELKEKITAYANKVSNRKVNEEVLLEFIRQSIREPKILERFTIDILIRRIENDIR